MTIKLSKPENQNELEDLFDFNNKEEELAHKAQMISYRILSEVDKICEERKINKKQLASLVGASPSYITQLFRGVRHINMDVMAKFEDALEFCFEIRCLRNTLSHSDILRQMDVVGVQRCRHNQTVWRSHPDQPVEKKAEQAKIIQALTTPHKNQQKAS